MCTFINAWPNQRILGYSIIRLWRDILPALLASAVMGAAVYGLQFFLPAGILGLGLQILAGAGLYLLLSALFRLESFAYLTGILKERLGRG